MKTKITLVNQQIGHYIDERWNFHVADNTVLKNNPTTNSLHYHSFFEVEIIYDGSAKHYFNNVQYNTKRGDVYLLRYFDAHRYEFSSNENLKIYNLIFNDIALPAEIINLFTDNQQNLFCHFEESDFLVLLTDIKQLLKEQRKNSSDPIHIHMMRAIFTKVILTILKKCLTNSNEHNEKIDIPFQQALKIVQCNFRDNITLKDISKQVGVTPNYLGQLFIRNLNMNFSAYLKKIRLEYAKNLLHFYDYSIEQIATLSGFGTDSHFISCFKNSYNITPKQCQLLKQKKEQKL